MKKNMIYDSEGKDPILLEIELNTATARSSHLFVGKIHSVVGLTPW
jgi:hypothetical protein